MQIESDAQLLGRFTPFRILSVYGGIDYNRQREALREGCDILVGTPGRLIDYLKQHVWSPRRVEVLVVDEADRMFDMGFIADLRFILRRLPVARAAPVLPLLGDALLPGARADLGVHEQPGPDLDRPQAEDGGEGRADASTTWPARRSSRLLLGLMQREGGDRVLIFSNTREEARRLEDRLIRNGWEARALTGDVDQKKRLRLLDDFKQGRLPVLVATDVASRGLHIEAVSHVVNWDLPEDAEDYVHRIGRTARAGAGGKAISLVDEVSALRIEAIEKFLGAEDPGGVGGGRSFVAEIPPTAEERRRYAEERRARLAARRGGERGPGRDRRPRERGPERGAGRRPEARPPAAPVPERPSPAAPTPPPGAAPGAAAGPGRRRRRSRRGRPRPGGPAPES